MKIFISKDKIQQSNIGQKKVTAKNILNANILYYVEKKGEKIEFIASISIVYSWLSNLL